MILGWRNYEFVGSNPVQGFSFYGVPSVNFEKQNKTSIPTSNKELKRLWKGAGAAYFKALLPEVCQIYFEGYFPLDTVGRWNSFDKLQHKNENRVFYYKTKLYNLYINFRIISSTTKQTY
jgi:hypothetical protein